MDEREKKKHGRGNEKIIISMAASILAVCIVLCLALQGREKSDAFHADGEEGKNRLEKVAADEANQGYEEAAEGLAIESEDGKCKVYVGRDQHQKIYIYHAGKEGLDEIDVMPDLADAIMSLEWFDANRVAAWSHVNPSCGCLSIYDVNTLQKLEEIYCSAYAWSEGMESLIYTESVPHNPSAIGEEKILNANDEMIYQTKKYDGIRSMDINDRGDIAIVVERMNKYFDVQSTKIMILKKKGKKYRVKEKIKLKKGERAEVEWIDHKTISYSAEGGGKKVKKLVN